MKKYFKSIVDIIINYHFYSITVLFHELIFILKYKNEYNKFKYLNSDIFSNAIPCPYYFLKLIKNFIIKKEIKFICDLGSGYGKILYFFGEINQYKIDGVEINKEIYLESLSLVNKNILVYNENILDFNLSKKKYDIFIINDPLKKADDFKILIKKICENLSKEEYVIIINLNKEKIEYMKESFDIIKSLKISRTRNIFFCRKI